MTREKIKNLLEFIVETGGVYTKDFLTLHAISTPEKCYNLYYGGPLKIDISKKRFHAYGTHTEGEVENNIDIATESIFSIFCDDISKEFHQAMKNLGWEDNYEILKYFDRDEHKSDHENLIKEVNRLVEN